MKLLWFHLMPYGALPEDFTTTHRSVWVDVDRKLFDPVAAHQMYNDYLDEMEFAAEVGFDGVCVNEHHANAYGMMPSPNIMAATMARRTKNAALCIMGNSLALYNPPIRVAEEMAVLDIISGGRVIAGFPVGSPMDTAYAYSQNPSMVRERYHEAHDLIKRAWTAEEPFDWNGRHYKMRDVNVWQQPVQKPHPPVWIPGGGTIETWEWAARSDYLYNYLSYYGYKLALRTMDGYWKKVKEVGKEPNPFRAGFLQFVGVANSKEEAIELYREPAEYFYNRCLHVDPRFTGPPGYVSEGSIRANLQSQVAAAASAAQDRYAGVLSRIKTTMEGFVEKGYIIVGSPDEVADQLKQVALDLNVGNMMVLLHYGNMKKDVAMYNTEMFATKVAPQLRGLFEDKWENHWWPKGMDPAKRARPHVQRAEAAE
ncbi:MAG TPA: LLM class flavin-dependent oxidoreductase [Rhizomicrobium sp.]|jgi:alkanesulfonate monooxygenase SsuD/methylene tetrahydromethanopterin reductase-like flavin-dependent oxidoreductase (luciferase family)|nr:LLM class flavin-dependent oxidoreductase [Rhizomicrobium sp.]